MDARKATVILGLIRKEIEQTKNDADFTVGIHDERIEYLKSIIADIRAMYPNVSFRI